MTAAVLGFFASSWFGWAQERPPMGWKVPLIAGSVASLLVAGVGAVIAWRNWSTGSALGEPGAMRHYGIIVVIEFGIAAVGAAAIALSGRSQYLAPWICLVVGVHFWPMAPVLQSPSLYVLGALLTTVAPASVAISRVTEVAQSAVTGAAAGSILVGFAAWAAVVTLT